MKFNLFLSFIEMKLKPKNPPSVVSVYHFYSDPNPYLQNQSKCDICKDYLYNEENRKRKSYHLVGCLYDDEINRYLEYMNVKNIHHTCYETKIKYQLSEEIPHRCDFCLNLIENRDTSIPRRVLFQSALDEQYLHVECALDILYSKKMSEKNIAKTRLLRNARIIAKTNYPYHQNIHDLYFKLRNCDAEYLFLIKNSNAYINQQDRNHRICTIKNERLELLSMILKVDQTNKIKEELMQKVWSPDKYSRWSQFM